MHDSQINFNFLFLGRNPEKDTRVTKAIWKQSFSCNKKIEK